MVADIPPPESPFPGIKPFSFAHRNVFFARRSDVRALMRLVILHRGVLVYAPSQRGKSSLLNAGLIPEAIAHGFQPERIRVQAVPGAECIVDHIRVSEAESVIRRLPSLFASSDHAAEVRVLSLSELMRRLIEAAAPADGRSLGAATSAGNAGGAQEPNRPSVKPLLIFDQFEEWVTAFEDAAVKNGVDARALQREILDAITGLINDHSLQIKIVLAFREDYLPRLDPFFQRAPSLGDHYLRLGALKSKTLYKVIRGPFMRYPQSYPREIPPGLARTIQAQFNEDPERTEPSLTELQIVCKSLFDQPELANELAAGRIGVKGILQRYFATRLDNLEPGHREPAVAILSSLITPAGTRKTVDRDTLLTLASGGVTADRTLAFAALFDLEHAARLIRREARRGIDYFEISSEFLVEWIRTEALARQARDEQRRLVQEREQAKANAAEMARRLQEQTERAEAENRRAEAEARRAETEKAAAETERRMKRKVVYALVAASAMLTVVLALMAASFVLLDTSVALSRDHIANTWVVAGSNELDHDPQLSAILVSQAAEVATASGRTIHTAEVGLHKAVRASHLLRGADDAATMAAISRGGAYVATVSAFGDEVTVRHEQDFGNSRKLPLHADGVTRVDRLCFSNSRTMPELIAVNADGSVDRIDPLTNAVQRNVLRPLGVAPSGYREIVEVVCSPDATRVVVATRLSATGVGGSPEQRVTVGDLASGRWSDEHRIRASHVVTLSSSGEWYTAASPGGQVTLVRTDGSRPISRNFGRRVDVTPSDDGKHVVVIPVSANNDFGASVPTATLWMVESGRTEPISLPNQAPIIAAAFSLDGAALLLQQPDLVWAWRIPSMTPAFSRPVAAEHALFTPDSNALLTWTNNVAELWRLESGEDRPLRLVGHADKIVAVAVAPGSGPLVTLGESRVNVWSRREYDTTIVTGFDHELNAVALSADGSRVVAGGVNRVLTYYDTEHGNVVDGEVLDSEILALAYGHGPGSPLVVGTADGVVRVKRDQSEMKWTDTRGRITVVTFSEDDTLVGYSVYAYGDLNAAVVRNAANGALIVEHLVPGEITSLVLDGGAKTLRIGVVKPDDPYRQGAPDQRSAEAPAALLSVPLASRASDEQRTLAVQLKEREEQRRKLAARDVKILEPANRSVAGPAPVDIGSGGMSRQGRVAVMARRQEQLEIWSDRGTPSSLPFGDTARVVAVAADGRHFAAGGEHGLLQFYVTDERRSPVTLQTVGSRLSGFRRTIVALAFNHGSATAGPGQYLASVTIDGRMKIFRLGLPDMRDRARSLRDGRPPLEDQECPGGRCATEISYGEVAGGALKRLLLSFGGAR